MVIVFFISNDKVAFQLKVWDFLDEEDVISMAALVARARGFAEKIAPENLDAIVIKRA